MRKAILPLMMAVFSVNALAANQVGNIEIGNLWYYWDIIFQLIQKLIVTDASRIVLTYILLFILFAKTLQVAVKKTPLGENASIIANSLAAIATISLFFKTRNFLDKFSWFIIIIGLAAVIWIVFHKFFGKFFHRNYSTRDKMENVVNKDKKRDKKEDHLTDDAQSNTNQEIKFTKEEEDIIKGIIHNGDLPKFIELSKKLALLNEQNRGKL